ncbi:MAG TPA: hypothetical protein VLG91_04020 [Streptomyces sp.]|nr:hypothetical protein [Streptomyces sp.]
MTPPRRRPAPPPPGAAPEGETARLLGSDVFGHGDEGDTDFDFGLDRVLDGIEVLVESRR